MKCRIRSEWWLILKVKEAFKVYNVSSEQFSGHTKQGFGLTRFLLWRVLFGMPYSLRTVAHPEVEMRRGKFETPRIKLDARHRKLDSPHRKFDLPRSKFETPRIKFDARHRKFDLPRGKFETPRIKLDARHRKLDSPHRKFRMSRFKCATRHCTLETRRLSGVLARKKSLPSVQAKTESRSSQRAALVHHILRYVLLAALTVNSLEKNY